MESTVVFVTRQCFLMHHAIVRRLKERLVLMITGQDIKPVLVRRIITDNTDVRSFMQRRADRFVKQLMRITAAIGHRCKHLMAVKPISVIVRQNVRRLMPTIAETGIIMITVMVVSNITVIANLNVRLL